MNLLTEMVAIILVVVVVLGAFALFLTEDKVGIQYAEGNEMWNSINCQQIMRDYNVTRGAPNFTCANGNCTCYIPRTAYIQKR